MIGKLLQLALVVVIAVVVWRLLRAGRK